MKAPPKSEGAGMRPAPSVQQTSFDTPNPTPASASEQRRAAVIVKQISDAPESAKKTLRDAFSGSASPRSAIKALCLTCVGFDRLAIKECSGHSCPVWRYRPFQSGDAK